ncbi:metal-dependent transcriptional regulator [Anaerotruncus massiliensis (ex Liu et al. 2021)]|uniref:metal-dependent transcriptional regulator n=1 Tax=Anaerotruncus massiliensis (ex Liu et al. 2021) TaxID=2321404 RepID=UPI003AB4578D
MLSPASIRYLLAVSELSDGGAAVRSVDIANALKVSRASVVKCLKRLAGEGMIRKEHYGAVQLTPEGVRESNRIFTEYTLLYAFFLQRLGVPPGCARRDAVSALCAFTAESREQLIRRVLEPSFAEES